MKFLPTSARFPVRRSAVIAVLLLLVFAVAAALAVQAYGIARHHRAQADRVLRDYAALAAARVAQLSAREIYWSIMSPLKALQRSNEAAPHKPPPGPKELHVEPMEGEFSLAPYIRFTFRLDLKTGALTTSGAAVPDHLRRRGTRTGPGPLRAGYDTAWHMGSGLGQPGGGGRDHVDNALARGARIAALPGDIAGEGGRAPSVSLAQALARAAARAPRDAASSFSAIYSRPSAAEEKHGAA